MADEVDFYAVLGLPPDADDATIRLAYRRLARRYHPDIAGDDSLHLMQTLNQAYHTLSDPDRRRLYDLSRPTPPRASAPPTPPAPPARPEQSAPQPTPQQPHRPTATATASNGPLRRITALDDEQASASASVAIAQDGTTVAAGHIDGQITLWQVAQNRLAARFALSVQGQAGTLSEVRLAADGTLLAAWGFALGLRIWHLGDGAVRWSSRMNAPSGLMDAVFLPHPAGLARLAVPDAAPALADDDPFHWADSGRRGTAVYTRPLPASGAINPLWAIPLRCQETDSRESTPPGVAPWQVRERVLSADGRRLLTFSTGRPSGKLRAQVLRWWELDARSRRGVVEPRRIAEITEPDGRLTFPLASSATLSHVALADFRGTMEIRAMDGRERRSVATGPVALDAFAALTPDGSLLALGDGLRLSLWETRTGQRLQTWQLPAPLSALTFAPTQTAPSTLPPLLAFGLSNGRLELWG